MPPSNPFLRYSSLAFELLAALGLGAWLGHVLDQKLGSTKPLATALLALLFLIAALYRNLRDLMREKN
jgi:F0F1-type ATP synthase assembly protein I